MLELISLHKRIVKILLEAGNAEPLFGSDLNLAWSYLVTWGRFLVSDVNQWRQNSKTTLGLTLPEFFCVRVKK